MNNISVERGTIIKISVYNFVTYDNAVIRPGRNLNVIIGPNGTGKSTIVCAIVLGLGGKPKVIGRNLHVGEYVKSGCEKAKIEIELHNPGNKNYLITRTFTSDGHTTWMLNERSATLKEVESLTKSLNIQVDNLCQFLPQDKVKAFSEMNPQQLLENTEKSVGDPILLEYHIKLKDYRERHVSLQEEIINKNNLLENQTQKYDRLKEIVGGIKEKTAIKKKITTLKQKKAWLLYDESREQLKNAQKVRNEAAKEMQELMKTMEPIQKKIEKMNKETVAAECSLNSHIKSTTLRARNVTNIVELLSSCEEQIQGMEKSLVSKIQAEATRDQEISTTEQHKSKLENDLERLTQEFGDEASLAARQQEIGPLINTQRNIIDKLAARMNDFKQEEEQIRRHIRVQQAEQQSVNDVEKQRLLLLKSKSQDAYNGVIWLRDNEDKFSAPIHEPMMLKINVKSSAYSKYFENVLSYRDLIAFICENKQDMNLLVKYLRDEQRLQVNCIHCDPNKDVNMNPHIPIKSIAQFGFENYMSSLVNAPSTIFKYLVSSYKINNIPIGDDNVENNVKHIPNSLNCFYSRSNFYSVSTSKYTGEKSTRMSRVTGNGSLSIILDSNKLVEIQKRLASLNAQKEAAALNASEIEKQLTEAEEKMRKLRAQRGECQHHMDRIKHVKTRIAMVDRKINDLQSERTSIDEIKETNKREINDIIAKQIKAYEKYNKSLEEYIESNEKSAYVKLEIKLLHRTLAIKRNEYREIKERCIKAEKIVRDFDNDLEPLKAETRRMFEDAKASTNGLTSRDEGFAPFVKAFGKLPYTIDEINDELKVCQAKVFCMGNTPDGDNVLRDYEKVRLDVEKLKHDVKAKTAELQNITTEMEDIRGKWIPPLQQLVDDINQNFSCYLSSMNCAGEVSITHGENILDFEQYGLRIKVKFRDTDELQELTSTHQSGGERSVTTAIYMIALQKLSTVPFRCVDEINQGMDATNERRIFELIVNITGQANGSQYFLLTPKLLPALSYTNTVTVHCVFNGPFAITHNEFDMNEYCKKLSRSK